MTREPAYRVGEDSRVDLLAIAGDHCVIQFVDQTHGEERAGVYDSRLSSLLCAQVLELFGQLSACSDVAKDDVAVVAKEQIVEVQFFPEIAGDVKFHAGFLVQMPSSRSNPNGPVLWCLEKNDGRKKMVCIVGSQLRRNGCLVNRLE